MLSSVISRSNMTRFFVVVALLALGATIVMTGSALSGAVMSFMRPAHRHQPVRSTSAFTGS